MVDSSELPPAESDRAPNRSVAYALVAEPDRRRAALYRDLVEDAGLEAVVTRNGDEAKAMLRRRDLPSLVIANLSLPRLDGFALLAELKRIVPAGGPPVLVISSSKELSGAAWNLKERLGVTELVAADADESTMRQALGRLLPSLRVHGRDVHAPLETAPAVAYERWVTDTLDRLAAEVARRFTVGLALVSVVIGDQEWFRVHVNIAPRPVLGSSAPRTWWFVREITDGGEPIVVPDVQQHPVYSKSTFPPAGTLRGYAGVPVISQDRTITGALCVFDSEPLTLDARALDALSDAAGRLAVELQAGLERFQTLERFTALSRLALTDPVTNLANRRGGEEAFAREVARARRAGTPLSLVLFDIDHFKQINDQAGHAVGDRVLRGVSDILSASQRGSDLAMRWGGEEFLVLLPDVGLAGARTFAERVRENVQNMSVAEVGRITISGGVAELQANEDAPAALARADASLYRAKAAGRNRVECDDPQSYLPDPWFRRDE